MIQWKVNIAGTRQRREGDEVKWSARRIVLLFLQWSRCLSLRRTMRVWEKIWRFLIEPADTLLRAAKQGKRRTTLQLVDWTADIFFEIKMLRRYIRGFADWENVTTIFTKELTKDDVIGSILLRGGIEKKAGYGTLHVKGKIDVLRKQAEFLGKLTLRSARVRETHRQELHPQIWINSSLAHVTKKRGRRRCDLVAASACGFRIATRIRGRLQVLFSYFLIKRRPQ